MQKDLKPMEIETMSFNIISAEMGEHSFSPENEPVVKRVVHTSADFDYVNNMVFSEDAVKKGIAALNSGECVIVTDTNMAKAGINKSITQKLGVSIHCFVADEDVAAMAKERGTTRSAIAMEKAAKLYPNAIFAIGNAPTALMKLIELQAENKVNPSLVIGVPVGFVNVVESKEMLMNSNIPHIVAKGRKGGSNVAAAICNAMIYQIER